jgi:hypothetical protein
LIAGQSRGELEAAGQQLRAIWAGFARTGHVDTRIIDGLITVAAD